MATQLKRVTSYVPEGTATRLQQLVEAAKERYRYYSPAFTKSAIVYYLLWESFDRQDRLGLSPIEVLDRILSQIPLDQQVEEPKKSRPYLDLVADKLIPKRRGADDKK